MGYSTTFTENSITNFPIILNQIVSLGSPASSGQVDSPEASPSEEKCVIKSHRVIVAARCDWFRRALQSGMREAIDR